MTDETKIKLEDLGYDEFFDLKWKALESKNSSVARIIAEHKETYRVKNVDGEYLAKITGKQIFNARKRADYPAVGDWISLTKVNNGRGVNELPRSKLRGI